MDEIRPLAAEVGILPRVHGSGLFTRGQTQVLTVATLGPVSDQQMLDGIDDEEFKRYIHHYNFPSYSVGETRPSRGPGRREIGHGALAERALVPVSYTHLDVYKRQAHVHRLRRNETEKGAGTGGKSSRYKR